MAPRVIPGSFFAIRFVAAALVFCGLGLGSTQAAAPASMTPRVVGGLVVDPAGVSVPGALVALHVSGVVAAEVFTDASGRFVFEGVETGPAVVTVRMEGFELATVRLAADELELEVRLEPSRVTEQVTVRGQAPDAPATTPALKTEAPLRDVPQAVAVVSRQQIAEQGMQGLADLVRFVPGVSMAQGEGNRDAVVFRGHASTADFLVDGLRDDVQYFRDLYNVERVEAVRGPNGVAFGRGGAGGVLNRVTRQAQWNPTREASFQLGSFDDRRLTVDVGDTVVRRAAVRLTGMYERAASYRDGAGLERYGVNPTAAVVLGEATTLRVAYEHFHDARTADRGVPSYEGRPLAGAPSTFFGSVSLSESRATLHAVNAALDRRLGAVSLRSRARYADYDKFYQNVFPGAVSAGGAAVAILGYNNGTTRQNLLHQTDALVTVGTWGVQHALAVGVEFTHQRTTAIRSTGYFGADGSESSLVPVDNPAVLVPVAFRPSATDANTRAVARGAAAYFQDEIQVSRRLRATVGLRYERFSIDAHNNRTGADLAGDDRLLSPRLAVVFRAAEPVSVYGSYSVTHLPRAGEQLGSLTVTNRALDPEVYRNYEVGAKWDVRPELAATAAVYHLERRNVAAADPSDPTRLVLVNGQRARGLEMGLSGKVATRWTVSTSYSYQDGIVVSSQSPSVRAGARLAQLPSHSLAAWSRYDWTPGWGAGVGVIHRTDFFASTDNAVRIPGFTRVDAALFAALSARLAAQLNVENLLDGRYFASAHSNNNIMPGSPRAARVTLRVLF